jgi:hypothetical protein
VWHRLKAVTTEEDAIEAIGDLRERLAEEDLLLPSGGAQRARRCSPASSQRTERRRRPPR